MGRLRLASPNLCRAPDPARVCVAVCARGAQEFCNASLQDALRNQLLHDPKTLVPDLDLVLTLLMDIARGMQYIHSRNIIHGVSALAELSRARPRRTRPRWLVSLHRLAASSPRHLATPLATSPLPSPPCCPRRCAASPSQDLTPGNVLLKQDADSPIGVVAKITDFGLCSTLQPGQSHISNITNGTPFYVAPEVVKSGVQTKTSDVYSYGVLVSNTGGCRLTP